MMIKQHFWNNRVKNARNSSTRQKSEVARQSITTNSRGCLHSAIRYIVFAKTWPCFKMFRVSHDVRGERLRAPRSGMECVQLRG